MSTQTCSQNGNGSAVGDNVACGSPNGRNFGSSGFRMLIAVIAVVAVCGGFYIWSQSTTEPTVNTNTRAQTPSRPNTPTPATTTVPTPTPAPSTPSTPTTPSGS